MIKPERLKELINDNANIYAVTEYCFHNESYITNVKLNNKRFSIYNDVMVKIESTRYSDEDGCEVDDIIEFSLKTLFEMFDEAAHYRDFGNIKRIETLSLPSWEQIKDKEPYYCVRETADFELYIIIDDYKKNNPLSIVVVSGLQKLFSEPLTKQNYTKACQLCKQLFLGKE